jgi:hypothetical protein
VFMINPSASALRLLASLPCARGGWRNLKALASLLSLVSAPGVYPDPIRVSSARACPFFSPLAFFLLPSPSVAADSRSWKGLDPQNCCRSST